MLTIGISLAIPAYRETAAGGGGGGDPTPPEGMAFLYAANGEPILDHAGEQIYALETA